MGSSSGFVPRRRTHGLVTEHVDGETLLYVEPTHRAYCLNAPAARVWALVDGRRDVAAIAAAAPMDAGLVGGALRELGEAGALENAATELPTPPAVDLSRRRMIAAGLVALPIILSITVPRAAEAASQCTTGLPGGAACTPAKPCCTGTCNENLGTCG